MKRTNLVLDEELLENARRALGERTYTATVTKALEALVRKHDQRRAFDELMQLTKHPDYDASWYYEEKAKREAMRGKRKISANEKRAPRSKKGRVRAAR